VQPLCRRLRTGAARELRNQPPKEETTMLFQLRTDNHIPNSENLADRVRAAIEGALSRRYTDQLRRVEVYLQDVNSHKGGIDTRCAIEAHLAGYQPVAVDNRATNADEAVSGAVEKLTRALEHRLERLGDRGGRSSMSGGET
jgi:hypothetical protein